MPALAVCSPAPDRAARAESAAGVPAARAPGPRTPAPTIGELGELTYAVGGLGAVDSLKLTKGEFKGEVESIQVELYLVDPRGQAQADSTSAVAADLDGDGTPEAVAVLHLWLGGTGQFFDLVVVGRRDGRLAELASAPLGDRILLKNVTVEPSPDGPLIRVDLVGHGRDDSDGLCCPTHPTVYWLRFARPRAGGDGELRLVRDSVGPRDTSLVQ